MIEHREPDPLIGGFLRVPESFLGVMIGAIVPCCLSMHGSAEKERSDGPFVISSDFTWTPHSGRGRGPIGSSNISYSGFIMVLVFVKSKLLFMLLLFSPIPSLAELLDVKVAFVLSQISINLLPVINSLNGISVF